MEYVKLNSISKILNGYNFKSNNYSNRGIRIIRITNVQDGFLEDNHPIFYVYTNELNKYMLAKNDILMSLTGNVGRVAIVTNEFLPAALNQRVVCIRCDQSKVEFKYLYYFFNNTFFKNYATKSSKGVAQLNMSTEWLKNITIPLRTKSNQIKIIEELDRITLLIEANNKKIHSLDNLVKSRFIEMFNNYLQDNTSQIDLIKCTKFIDYRGKTPNKSDSGIRLFTAKNVKMHALNFEPAEFIKEEVYDKHMTRGFPKPGDLLFSTEAPLGNVCIIPKLEEKFSVGQRLITIVPDQELNSRYLEFYMSSDYFQEKVWRESSGSTVKGIKSKLLEKLPVSIPNINKQNEFASFVKLIDKSKYCGGHNYVTC